MTEGEVLASIARAFPGVKVLPRLFLNDDGLANCTQCLHAFPQATNTALVDSDGLPWHTECLMRYLGIEETTR